jgi:Bacterial Ig domain
VTLTAPGAGATVSGTRAVSASATDNTGGSGVAGVQFLLDGAPLGAEDTAAPYSIQWNTTTATEGVHSLSAVARDRAGNTRTSATRNVTVRNGGLAVGPPSAALGAAPGPVVAGTSVAAVETAPVVVSWPAASIASGTTYTLQRSLNGGGFQNVAANGARTLTQQLRAGTYAFRVRAVNGALTATSAETTVVVRTDQETAATVAGAWTTNAAATWWNGSLRFASANTASTTYTFTGRSFGLVSTRANSRGRLSVSIDGGAATKVDLFNATQQARRIVFSRNGLAAGSHTVVVRVLGTRNASSRGTRVDVDGFVVLG